MPKKPTKLNFWGVRGSTPTVDRATRRYGGNTPCLELETPEGGRFILDCGTGLRMLGKGWAGAAGERSIDAHIFVTHYHWDHIQGLPFFSPLYAAGNRFHFYSFCSDFLGRDSLKRVFETQMAHPYFPVDLTAMSATREFREVADGDCFEVGETRVITRMLNHPGGCLGFRFETSAGTIVYATDNEPGRAEYDQRLQELAQGADIFINDAQYTPEQLERHRGWGHSSWLDGVRTAQAAGARHLVLFHHDPDSSDKHVDANLARARETFENTWAACEGMKMTLSDGLVDVALPVTREGQRRQAHFRARVSGLTQEGQVFEEGTEIRELTLQGALLYLAHVPRVQSELQVMIENPGEHEGSRHLTLRGVVVRTEPEAGTERVGVGVIFTA